jgi:hypothetical protein
MSLSLRLPVKIDTQAIDINYQTPVLFMGSCFSDNIGAKLKRAKLPVMLNPFGVLYNPVSIHDALISIIHNTPVDEKYCARNNSLWYSYMFHGSFSDPSKENLLRATNKAIKKAHKFLAKASVLFITFGTARVYEHVELKKVVANCHKESASKFLCYRLSPDDITHLWKDLLVDLHRFNPNLRIVFTVSPVRHLKDGAHQNQLSKAVLFLAIDQLLRFDTACSTRYFPSYEIVHDELRDYRFYADDMTHISSLAVDYIFEKFSENYFSKPTQQCVAEMFQLAKALEHRVFGIDRQGVNLFKERMLAKMKIYVDKYPQINFDDEIKYFAGI